MSVYNIFIILTFSMISILSCGEEDRTDRINEMYGIGDGICLDNEDCEGGYYCVENNCTYNPCPYGNFPNHNEGRCWSDEALNEMGRAVEMDRADAISYCEGLGGHLPTISELRTLIQKCSQTETGGSCGVTDSCLSYSDCWNDDCSGCSYDSSGKYSVFGDIGWIWSSSVLLDNANDGWYVNFRRAGVGTSNRGSYDNDVIVRCVH